MSPSGTSRGRGEAGQMAPLAAIFVTVSLAALGLLFLQYGRATDVRAEAQTAADAAALAAADDYARQVEELLDGPGLGRVIQFLRNPLPDQTSMSNAAARLATDNDSSIRDIDFDGNQVAVLVATDAQVPDEPAPVPGDRRGTSTAQAETVFPILETCRIEAQPEPTPSPSPSPTPSPGPSASPSPSPSPPPPPPPPLPDLLICDGIRQAVPVGRIAGALRDELLEVEVRLIPVTANLG
jgi:type II secretory pathway pseudopilin PulG